MIDVCCIVVCFYVFDNFVFGFEIVFVDDMDFNNFVD